MLRPALRSLLPTLACVAGLIALTLALQLRPPGWLARADLAIQDAWMSLKTPRSEAVPARLAVLVDIDPASAAEYGPWPWPRFLLAELIQRLVDLGVAAVGLDLDLSGPDLSSPERVAEDLWKWRELDLDLADLPDDLRDYDLLLARAIEPLPVVLGAPVRAAGPDLARAWPLAVLSAAAPTGLTGLAPDPDGVVRRVQLVARAGEGDPSPGRLTSVRPGREVHLALGLRTLLRALGRDEIVLATGPGGLEALQAVAPWDVPLDRDGGFTVFFKNSGEYTHLSAADVLAGRAAAEGLKGRLVFVSVADANPDNLLVGPGNLVRPAAEIHAALIDNLAARRFVTRPAETPAIQFLLILGAGLTGGLAFAFARPARALAGGLFWPAAAVGGSIHIFQTSGLFVSPLYAILATALSGLVLAGRRLIGAERKRDSRRRDFTGRTAPETAARLARLEDDLETVQEREVTVMAADLRDLLGRPSAALLERNLARLADLVLASRGTLDHFRGAALLAFWNAPLPLADHPAAAVTAALAMIGAKAGAKAGASRAPKIGLGLHTGPALAGRLGPPALARYTILGETVGLSHRLERLGRLYGVEAAVSGATRQACGGAFVFQPLDILRLTELEQPLAVFAPLGPEEAKARAGELERQAEALAFYRAGEFQKAQLLFRALSARHPGLGLYEIFAWRCERLLKEPPAEWTGIWNPGQPRPVF